MLVTINKTRLLKLTQVTNKREFTNTRYDMVFRESIHNLTESLFTTT